MRDNRTSGDETGLGINPFYRELFSYASLPVQGWTASNRRNALLKGVFITMNAPFSYL